MISSPPRIPLVVLPILVSTLGSLSFFSFLGFFILFYIENIQIMFLFALFIAIIGFSMALIIQEPSHSFDKEIIVPIDEGVKVIPQREHISFPIILPSLTK